MRASGLSFQAGTLHNLGYVALRQGAADEAEDRFREALEIFRRNGDQRGIAECLAGLGGVAAERGDGTRAARAFGAASRLLEEIGADIFPTNRRDYEVSVTRARTQLDEHAFNAAWAEGHAMSPKTAIDDTLGE
jgi:tetratricopeptide (TPR) repeat protein